MEEGLMIYLRTFKLAITGMGFAFSFCMAVAPFSANASSLAIQEFNSDISAANQTDNRTWGWQFTPSEDILVEALGFWDQGADGFGSAHEVGIWNTSQTLLASVTFNAGTGSALEGPSMNNGAGRFRFEDISTLSLIANTQYVIGGTAGSDLFYFASNSVSLASILAGFPTSGNERVSDAGTGFAYPNRGPHNRRGYYGPNFLYSTPSAIPVPAAVWLFGTALFGLVGFGKRKKAV
jgi:hypothetical protein